MGGNSCELRTFWPIGSVGSAYRNLELNIPVAWINRKSEPLPEGLPKPHYVVSDLNELADHLGT